MMTPLINRVEAYGLAVSEGLISRSEAIKELVKQQDGGLTEFGAADLLDKWKTTRDRYAGIAREAREELDRLDGNDA